MSQTTKILLIAGFIIFVGAVGYLLYIVFFQPLLPTVDITNQTGINGALPVAGINANRQPLPAGGGTLPTLTNGNANINAGPTPALPKISDVARGGLTRVSNVTDTSAYYPSLSSDGTNVLYYN